MKRHNSLVPLSHDHQRGLLLAQLIKRKAPAYKGLPKDIPGKIEYTLNAYAKELSPHFKNEEEILFPAARGNDADLDTMLDEIINEHRQIESMIEKLKIPGSEIEKLDVLGKKLDAHIRKEERILFPLIEKTLGEKLLSELGNKIVSVKDGCDI